VNFSEHHVLHLEHVPDAGETVEVQWQDRLVEDEATDITVLADHLQYQSIGLVIEVCPKAEVFAQDRFFGLGLFLIACCL
jgi:hypothetical protein